MDKVKVIMQEIHAVANGDGSYSADMIADFGGRGMQRFQTPRCFIQVDDLVVDPQEQMPPVIHMTFGNEAFPEGFQFP